MSDPTKTLAVIAEMLKLEWQEERQRALDVLNSVGSDTKGADLVTACHVVTGDYRGAMSGRDSWKREAEALLDACERAEKCFVSLFGEDANHRAPALDALRAAIRKAKGEGP
jgi:sugar phosphate isomerase/epimerase